MRGALIKLMNFYRGFARWRLRRRGLTEEDEAAQRIVSGTSWDEFCDTLKAAGGAISGFNPPTDPRTQAEGYRYLTRLLRAGLEAFVEFNDPAAPVLRRMVHETVKMGADNPDNMYYNATISGEYEYRLSGTRGTVHFLGFSTQRGNYGRNGGMPTAGFLDAADMEIDADGRFEILMSQEEKGANWLPMTPDAGTLIVRQTFMDRVHEVPAQLVLERIDGDGLPEPVTARSIDEGLKTASNLVAGASLLFAKWAKDFRSHTNRLPRFDQEKSNSAGGDPKIAYYHSYWSLETDEALIIEATPPECSTWNFQLNNHWMESLDYRYYTIHINKHTAVYEPDGSVRIVVAHEDPGIPNWINTTGHRYGTMCFRWVKAASHPQPETRVVKFSEIAAPASPPSNSGQDPAEGNRR